MLDSYLSTKFGINSLDGFLMEKMRFTDDDGRRTMDACATVIALLTQSSRAKNFNFFQKKKIHLKFQTFYKSTGIF